MIHDDVNPNGGELAPVAKLSRDVRATAAQLDRDQARELVDLYYRLQEHRIALAGQERSLTADGRPSQVVHHFGEQMFSLERQMVSVLGKYAQSHEVGRWSLAPVGVGPVLSAGLLAHIDIERAPTVGHIWRFAGLDPTAVWNKGERRPWNASLKVVCWKIGDSFVKQSGHPDCVYGHLYRQRKEIELQRNEAGLFAEQAARTLATRRIRDAATRVIYESGRLPAGRLDLRARRWAVKLFLAHWHEVAYEDRYGTPPPAPYPLAHLGHAHRIALP